MKKLTPVILIVVILALLVITNPTKQDFAAWYGNRAAASAPAGEVGKVLGGIGREIASGAASLYQRTSYGIFSVFRPSKNGAAYVGFAKALFIKVK